MRPQRGEKSRNIKRVESLLSGMSADIIVLPELFDTGYLFKDRDELLALAEPFRFGETFQSLSAISSSNSFAIAAGFAERDGDILYNSQLFVTPSGDAHLYRKLHLFDREKSLFEPGNIHPEVVEFRGGRIGQLICFDWIFPEIYRHYALKGADLVLHSSNLVLPYCQRASFARAVENRIFLIIANRTGSEALGDTTLDFTGGSIIYSPTGDVLAEASRDGEELRIVDVDIESARDKWVTPHNHLLNDRRTDMYELCDKSGGK